MSLPVGIHRLSRRFGIDLTQLNYAHSEWAVYMKLLYAIAPDVVVDVGANTGQFASELRLAGYTGTIVSFEPVGEAFHQLSLRADQDPAWTAIHCALGAERGDVTINIAANSMSSSLLAMSDEHIHAAPDSTYVGHEEVPVYRLDEIEALEGFSRIFCKIDTQGYERHVLQGSSGLWSKLVAVQLETSHVGLYEDSWMHDDVMSYFTNMNWEPVFVTRGFTDSRTGRMLQSDWTFAPRPVVDDLARRSSEQTQRT